MLNTVKIGRFTVSQMGPLQAARLRLHLKNLDAANLPEEVDDVTRYNYALLAACTEPFISWQEYTETFMGELAPLTAAVEELNADMAQAGAGAEAKKKRR
jgi:hypothetical protein